jgi:hypothetical protein
VRRFIWVKILAENSGSHWPAQGGSQVFVDVMDKVLGALVTATVVSEEY